MAGTMKRASTVTALVLLLMGLSIASSSFDVRAGEKVVALVLLLYYVSRVVSRAGGRRATRVTTPVAAAERPPPRLMPTRTRAGVGLSACRRSPPGRRAYR